MGWIGLRRADDHCAACGVGQAPLDGALGVGRDSYSAGLRRAVSHLGAQLPFAQAAVALAEVAAWVDGVPPADGPAPKYRTATGEPRRAPASYASSFAVAEDFGRRLALEAHRRGLEDAAEVVGGRMSRKGTLTQP